MENNEFCVVNVFKKIYNGLKKNLKFSISDPGNFDEILSFSSNGIRVLSLFFILIIAFSFLLMYLFKPVSGFSNKNDVSIEREKLEKQNEKIAELSKEIESQENYINNIKLILLGEIPIESSLDTVVRDLKNVDFDKIESDVTKSESSLAKKVKYDMSTKSNKEGNVAITYFGSPVVGVISQRFDKQNHPGIDVVTEKDKAVKSCLSGTVIYSGYSRKDGHMLIVDHSNKFLSVYKHNKRVLKKSGSKVQLGDPIAIVGNTGENTDGPHLHFELWYDQSPVNPEDYMNFKR